MKQAIRRLKISDNDVSKKYKIYIFIKFKVPIASKLIILKTAQFRTIGLNNILTRNKLCVHNNCCAFTNTLIFVRI